MSKQGCPKRNPFTNVTKSQERNTAPSMLVRRSNGAKRYREETFIKGCKITEYMHAVIHNYRRSIHKPAGNQMIVVVEGVDTRAKAQTYVGKTVVYSTGKKDVKGEVRSAHGNKGALRVLFETGMPGQAIGQEVKFQ